MQLDHILSIFIAGVLGGLIGYERLRRSKGAGVRTHFLVGLGSALFMVISKYGFGPSGFDAARVAAQVVSGIGFIGAGVIIFQQNVVRGITTAAGLWVTAAIGLACGAGLYVEAVFATVAVLLVLELMHAVLPSAGDNVLHVTLSSDDRERLAGAVEALRNEVLDIESCRISFGGGLYRAALDVHVRNRDRIEGILQLLRGIEGVGLDAIE